MKITGEDQGRVQSEAGRYVNGGNDDARLSRRRALLAGLAATPVVLTIFGRSAFAQSINCSVAQSVLAGTSLHPGITKEAAKSNSSCSL